MGFECKPYYLEGYYIDHTENCDMLEEDSVDRLWLVVRSLKNPEGKFVRTSFILMNSHIGLQDQKIWRYQTGKSEV